jgi:PAS domain S-box-containing protein
MNTYVSAVQKNLLPGLATVAILFILSRYNYLVFHALVELFSIIVIISIFMFTWNARRFMANNYFLCLSIAFLFVGFLDFMHAISYKGMNILPVIGSNTATQLWIAARSIQGLSLLIAPFFIQGRLKLRYVVVSCAAITVFLLASIFLWGNFPDCYIEGAGLTPFERVSEFVIAIVLAVSAALLYKKKTEFDEDVLKLLIAAIVVTIFSELAFTLYDDVYDLLNLIGHLLKILAFYLIYKALIKTGFEKPYSTIFRDLKNKEKELTYSHDFIKTALDSMNDAILVINVADYSIVECNTVFLNEVGLKKEDVIGKECYEITHRRYTPCEAPHDSCPLQDILKTGRHSVFEHIHYDGAGNPMHVEVSASPIKDADGNVIHIVHVSRNVSERRLAEDKIRELNANLESRVEELKKVNETTEASARSKSEFLANMSHEIRTPMNAIMGMANLVLETKLTLEQKEYLEVINQASQSLLTLLNDILNLSKIESGKLELESVVFDLKSAIAEALSLVRLQAAEKKLTLEHSIQPGTPMTLKGDPTRLKQVLVNLLGNAVKFTDKGCISLQVRELPSEDNEETDSKTLWFSVHDTGIGIPYERQKEIFDVFAQADGSVTRKYGGTGLGLAICKRLVELMNGTLWVDSEPQKETTFHFTVVVEAVDVLTIEDRPKGSGGALQEGVPLKILLAEDNDFNQILVVRLLEREGHSVTVAVTGARAVEYLEEERFDLVLMDIQMPEMDGFTATNIIRDAASGVLDHDVPIIAMTANAMSGDREKCLAAGMNDYISKPINPEELHSKIRMIKTGEKAEPVQERVSRPDAPIIDMVRFWGYVGNDEKIMAMLLDAFNKSSSERMDNLIRAHGAGDISNIARESHTLKSMAASMGAETMAAIALEIETAGRAGQPVSVQLIGSLKEELDKVLDILSRISESPPP